MKERIDASDLPPELLAELRYIELSELETQLVAVIKGRGGMASLNQVLIGLYRQFGVIQKRRFLQQKLNRMSREDIVRCLPKPKGAYCLPDFKSATSEQ